MISIAEEISVPSPPDKVWAVVSHPTAVVSCIQGAELGAVHDDGSFDGSLLVKFGALRVRFAAQISLELAEAELEGRLSARGRDGQGATRFSGSARFRVAESQDPGHSLVTLAGEVNLAGKLASLIESGAGAVVPHGGHREPCRRSAAADPMAGVVDTTAAWPPGTAAGAERARPVPLNRGGHQWQHQGSIR